VADLPANKPEQPLRQDSSVANSTEAVKLVMTIAAPAAGIRSTAGNRFERPLHLAHVNKSVPRLSGHRPVNDIG
jgi:hypothetical protein